MAYAIRHGKGGGRRGFWLWIAAGTGEWSPSGRWGRHTVPRVLRQDGRARRPAGSGPVRRWRLPVRYHQRAARNGSGLCRGATRQGYGGTRPLPTHFGSVPCLRKTLGGSGGKAPRRELLSTMVAGPGEGAPAKGRREAWPGRRWLRPDAVPHLVASPAWRTCAGGRRGAVSAGNSPGPASLVFCLRSS